MYTILSLFLFIGFVTNTLSYKHPSVFRLKGDEVVLQCPTLNKSSKPLWRRNDTDSIVIDDSVNKSDILFGRIRVLGLQDNNSKHVITIDNATKKDIGNYCCSTIDLTLTTVFHCTQVFIFGFSSNLHTDGCTHNIHESEHKVNFEYFPRVLSRHYYLLKLARDWSKKICDSFLWLAVASHRVVTALTRHAIITDDIIINETEANLYCTMKNQSNIFTYSWRHNSFSGHHLECDDVDGQSIHLKKTSLHRSEGKYICTVQYSNKSNGNGINISKSYEIKQNQNLSCKGDAKIEYSTKRKSIAISFLVQSSNIMNHIWKRNEIDLISPKFSSNVRIIKDIVIICNKSVEVNSTIYRLEIRDVVATDFNQSYTLAVPGSKDIVSCSHYLTQTEINTIGDKTKTTNVLSYYILVCFCLAMLFGASALLISFRRKAKRRQNLT